MARDVQTYIAATFVFVYTTPSPTPRLVVREFRCRIVWRRASLAHIDRPPPLRRLTLTALPINTPFGQARGAVLMAREAERMLRDFDDGQKYPHAHAHSSPLTGVRLWAFLFEVGVRAASACTSFAGGE